MRRKAPYRDSELARNLRRSGVIVAVVTFASIQFVLLAGTFIPNNGSKQPWDNDTYSYRRKYAMKTPLPGLDSAPKRQSVAILIAGQCHRFIYRDQHGPLFWTVNATSPSNYEVDVYIALQCGKIVPPHVGTVDSPPYMKQMKDTDIAEWYLKRGAKTVTIEIISTKSMDVTIQDIVQQATTSVRQLQGFELAEIPAWFSEVRKFYLRHYVFAMSLKPATRQYDAYVFNREDNFYLTPLDLEGHYFDKGKAPNEPFVIVDASCEFHAYSDKMYIANHLGAALLFSSTRAEFIHWMKRFMLVGLLQKRFSFWRPYQAESFVHDSLKSVTVERIDLQRVDVRYNGRIKCIPIEYFLCMPETTRKLAKKHKLATCSGLKESIRWTGYFLTIWYKECKTTWSMASPNAVSALAAR